MTQPVHVYIVIPMNRLDLFYMINRSDLHVNFLLLYLSTDISIHENKLWKQTGKYISGCICVYVP